MTRPQNFALAAALVLTLLPAGASAQFAITGASISDGEAGVPLVDSIYFSFNQLLPFNTFFTQRFFWEPKGHFQRTEVFLDADRMNPRFRLVHQQNYDFAVYVFGVAAENGSRMQRPFTLNYTTSATSGSRQVSGAVSFGTRTPPSMPRLATLIHDHYEDGMVSSSEDGGSQERIRMAGALQNQLMAGPAAVTQSRKRQTSGKAPSQNASHVSNLDYTVILLLDQFSIDSGVWSVRAATAISPSGTYSFDHVRDGTYYPVAFNYSDDTGVAIGHYAYYDPDGDFSPDPVVVSGGNLTGVDLTLYSYGTTQALTNREIAVAEAQANSADAVLVNVSGHPSLDGTATYWTYLFRSESLAKDILVSIDPLTVESTVHTSAFASATTPLPQSGLVDSGSAVSIADINGGSDFRASNANYAIDVLGGNQLGELPQEPTRLMWRVRYSAGGSPDPPFVIYIDMLTGDPIDDLPVELTRLDALVDRGDVVIYWSTASEVDNVGFHVEQALPASNSWKSVGFVPASTADSPPHQYSLRINDVKPGRYVYRLQQVDVDGTSHYSAEVEVEVKSSQTLSLSSVYPNPIQHTGTFEISSNTGKSAVVTVYDVLGRVVKKLYDGPTFESQVLVMDIDASDLSTGSYFVEARIGTARKVQFFSVAK